MKNLFSKCFPDVGQFDKENGNFIIPKQFVDRWKRQMNTPYDKLSDEEKDSDRKEALKFIQLIKKG